MGVVVRQKAKGKGQLWWVFVSHQGKRTSRKVGSKGAAKQVAAKIEAKLALGEFACGEKEKRVPTFGQYCETFMSGYSKANHKESTRHSYRMVLDRHLLPVFGSRPINEIKRKEVKAFIYQKQEGSLSANSVRIIKAYLSCILSQAVDDEIIIANVAARTGKFINNDESVHKSNPLEWEEKTLFEKTAKEHFPRHYPLLLCDLRTGLRWGELIALEPGDIDFNGRFIEVRRSCVRGEITTPKNGKTRRVDMSAQLAEVLKAHMTERKKEALRKGWGEPPRWLFYNKEGNLLDLHNFRKRVFNKILEKAGLRRIRIHDLRHTTATLRIAAGHDVTDVSKQLGHSSIKITVDIYYKWIPGTRKSEVDQLDLEHAPTCTPTAPTDVDSTQKRANHKG